MSLRVKVISLILCSFVVYGILDYKVLRKLILPSFISLEQEESLKNMDRAVQVIDREIQHLGASAIDWSHWDDTYQFTQDQNNAYIEANLEAQTLEGLKVNMLCIFDADQQQVWGMVYDLENQREISIPGLTEKLGKIQLTDPGSKVEGILLTDHGPVLISATPVLTSDSQGPAKGFFVLGRFLNTLSISEQARIRLHATALGDQAEDPETQAILAQINDQNEKLVQSDDNLNRVYKVLPGIDEKPALLLQVDNPRLISAKGEKAVRYALLSILGAGFVIVFVMIIGLQKIVLSPLKELTDHTVAIGQSDNLDDHHTLNRSDEIGILSQEYDRMIGRLTATRKSLMDQSYRSGMAEVAIGVLHNVGNVLNSVNVSSTLIKDQLRQSSIGDVSRVAALMDKPEGGLGHFLTRDERGQMIPEFIASLAHVLEEERHVLLKETELLSERIDHIKEIIIMQQNYGKISAVSEPISPEQLMEDALKLNAAELVQHEVTVQREFQPVPLITVDKHKVLQILINLISNAKHACNDSGCEKKIIALRIINRRPNSVIMQVADNGVGITRENITRLFQYGFTTRTSGHGFGLHNSALTARELGGSLTADSDGHGSGAAFTLELPCLPGDKT